MEHKIDVTREKPYGITLTQNIHRRHPEFDWHYEFDSAPEVVDWIENNLGNRDPMILERDMEKDHGTLSDTSWYKVIKKYRDVPDCMMW